MSINLIAAVSENNVIGKDNQIPWRIKKDMQRFQELTLNHPVIMGRKTYESLTENKDSYIMGGTKVYEEFLPLADKFELTRVHKNVEGDAFFPKVNWDQWNKVYDSGRLSTEKGTEYSFQTYLRKS
jgi:dihydrofolate reductase